MRARAGRRPVRIAALGVAVVGLVAAGFLVTAALTPEERTTVTDEGLPYTLEVPQSWTMRTAGAGDTTVSVLSPADLTALFLDEPAALEGAARTPGRTPPAPSGSPSTTVRSSPPAPARRPACAAPRASCPAPTPTSSDLGAQRPGTRPPRPCTAPSRSTPPRPFEVHVLVVETDPVQMLVFFAPTRLYDDRVDLFTEVADSLRLKG